MSDDDTLDGGTRFPFINLEKAIGRAQELYSADQRGREMATAAAFGVWGYSEKSSGGFQTIAALKMYGLIATKPGKLALTDGALRYFRDEREVERQKLLREFALKPKLVASLWKTWHVSPPADTIARSHLKAERGLTDQSSRSVLAIYKENLAFANLTTSDKPLEEEDEKEDDSGSSGGEKEKNPPPPPPPPAGKVKAMPGERELTTGLLSKDANFRLLVSGPVGVKEIERLIAKLELDKEILSSGDYVPGSWHSLVFKSDLAEQETKNFAVALRKQWDDADMPKGCAVKRHNAPNGDVTILLSPRASELAAQIPYAKPLLESVSPPADFNNVPGFTPMGVFT
jgi:hypothetical protein